MAINNNVDLVQEGNKKLEKKPRVPKNRKKTEAPLSRPAFKGDNHLFTLVVVAIVILGVIGVVFGYTKDRIMKIDQGGTQNTKELESQMQNMAKELQNLREKANVLEADTASSKDVVIDLFDRNREIPVSVNTDGWTVLKNADLSFAVSYPQSWEALAPAVEAKVTEKTTPKLEVITLQPKGVAEFANALTIKSDYPDFVKLPIVEKLELFKGFQILDTRDFASGKMLYFINIGKDKQEIPTIVVLTKDNIYRLTFNIADKKLARYFTFRTDFEKIAATFALATPVKK